MKFLTKRSATSDVSIMMSGTSESVASGLRAGVHWGFPAGLSSGTQSYSSRSTKYYMLDHTFNFRARIIGVKNYEDVERSSLHQRLLGVRSENCPTDRIHSTGPLVRNSNLRKSAWGFRNVRNNGGSYLCFFSFSKKEGNNLFGLGKKKPGLGQNCSCL